MNKRVRTKYLSVKTHGVYLFTEMTLNTLKMDEIQLSYDFITLLLLKSFFPSSVGQIKKRATYVPQAVVCLRLL